MEKRIDDYLQYYIGCNIIPADGRLVKMTGLQGRYVYCECPPYVYPILFLNDDPKLVLRPLSELETLPDDEAKEIFEAAFNDDQANLSDIESIQQAARMINELRRRGFDCDGLIEAGLAIEKKG